MKGLIGKKVGMTQVFDETGQVIPVTVIEAGPCYVTQIKTEETDGYSAIQLGFEQVEPHRLNLPQRGHLRAASSPHSGAPQARSGAPDAPGAASADGTPTNASLTHSDAPGAAPARNLRILREFRVSDPSEYQVGQAIAADIFGAGQRVDVVGTSKGRGFAGVIKRYGFHRQPQTHGMTDRVRAPGAIGACTWPGRVWKGKKMPGHMGSARKTAQNLLVVLADPERNLLLVRGGVPGPNGGLVLVQEGRKQ